jgi:hypothetical protein
VSSPPPVKWPDPQPVYVPDAVWEFALEWKDRSYLDPREAAVLPALLGPDMRLTWKHLQRQRVRDVQSWRHIFDLFVLSTPGTGFDPGLRDGIKRAGELLPVIAERARALADLLADLRDLSDEYALTVPLELTSTLALLRRAGYHDPPRPPGPLMSESEREIDALALPDVLAEMAVVAEDVEAVGSMLRVQEWREIHDHPSVLPSWVKYVDETFLNLAEYIWPPCVSLRNADLERVFTAVTGLAPGSRAMGKYRLKRATQR